MCWSSICPCIHVKPTLILTCFLCSEYKMMLKVCRWTASLHYSSRTLHDITLLSCVILFIIPMVISFVILYVDDVLIQRWHFASSECL